MARGFRGKCPECGGGRLFAGYVRTRDVCAVCGLNLDGHESDDAPPYVTIMIVGHVAVPLALAARQVFDLPLGVQFAIWGPVVIAMTAWLLPAAKGGLIGVQWANRMHGFGDGHATPGEHG